MFRIALVLFLAVGLSLQMRAATHAEEDSTPRLDRFGDPLTDGALVRLGTLRFRGCHCAAYSPDGKIIATANGGALNLWDAATYKHMRRVPIEGRWFDAMTFSHDGKKLAVAGSMGESIHLWDIKTFEEVELKQANGRSGGGDWGHSVAFSDDDKTVVGATSRAVFVWDIASGKNLSEFPFTVGDERVDVRVLTISDDGKVAATRAEKKLHLWDTQTGKLLRQIDLLDGGETMRFSRDGKTLAVSGYGHWLNIFSVETGKKLHALQVTERVLFLEFSSDGKALAAVSNQSLNSSRAYGDELIQTWDLGNLEGPPLKHAAPDARTVKFSPDGKVLAWESCGQTLCFMDRATGKDLNPTASHRGTIMALVYLPDGKRIASAGVDGDIRIWDGATGECLNVLKGHGGEVHALALFPNGKLLASCGRDCTLRLWDTEHGKALAVQDDGSPVVAAAFSRDGKWLASGGHSGVTYLRHPATGKTIERLETHSLDGLAFSPDTKMIAVLTESFDGKQLLLHDLVTSKVKKIALERVGTSVTYSPDGKILAVGCDEVLTLLDTATNRVLRTLPGHWNRRGCLAFSADSRYLASVCDGNGEKADRAIRVFEVATATEIYSFKNDVAVFAAAFSPDGSKLAVGGGGATALILDLTNLSGKKRAEKLTDDELTARWESLTETDAGKTYEARADLLHAPKSVVPFLATLLQPAPAINLKRVEGWIKKLDSEEFKERDEANKELEQLGELVREPMRKALDADPPLEKKKRLQTLLANLDSFTPTQLRIVRAIGILEGIGTPEALKIIEKLTKGNPDGLATTDSRTVIARREHTSAGLPEVPKPQGTSDVEMPPPGPVLKDRDGDPMPAGAIARLGSARWRLADEPRRIVSSADGKSLAVVTLADVETLDSKTGVLIDQLQDSSFCWRFSLPASVALSADWRKLAAVARDDDSVSRSKYLAILDRGHAEKVRIDYLRKQDEYPVLPEEVEAARHVLGGWSEYLSAVEFAPDAKTLVGAVRFEWRRTGGDVQKEVNESHLIAWDAASGKQLWKSAALPDDINTIAFSNDGKTMTVVDRTCIRFWDADKGKELRRWESKDALFSACYSPDRSWLATAGKDDVLLWEMSTGKVVRRFELPTKEHREIQAIGFSADSKLLVGGADKTIRVWDRQTGKLQVEISGFPTPVEAVTFSRDNKTLFSGHQKEHVLRRWDVSDGKASAEFDSPITPVGTLSFSKDSRTILASSTAADSHLWEAESGKLCPMPKNLDDAFLAAWLPSSGQSALLTSGAAVNRPFAVLLTGKPDPFGEWPDPRGASADGQRVLMVLSKDNSTCLSVVKWHRDLVQHKEKLSDSIEREVIWNDGNDVVAALSPDGKTLVAAGPSVLCFYDVATGKERRLAHDQAKSPEVVKFSLDGSRIALVSEEGKVRILAVKDGRTVAELGSKGRSYNRAYGLAFSPDGQTLLMSVDDSPVHVWEVATGQMVRRLEPGACVYSPDNRLVASESTGTLRISDLYSGRIIRECKAQGNALEICAFSPNSKLLAACCSDTTIVVWPTSPAEAKAGKPLDEKGLAEVLQKGEAPAAYEAIGRMIADPERALPFLEGLLRPAPKVEKKGSADTEAMSSEEVLHIRGIQALERIGTKRARQLLEKIAKGDELRPRTRAAAEAVKRLDASGGG